MFVSKINGISQNVGFKGYQHIKNSVGEDIMRFNYVYDYENETCEVRFFRVTPTDKYNYKIDETPIASVQLKPDGVNINLQEITNLDSDENLAYQIVRKDKNGNVIWQGADTGSKVKKQGNEFVYRNGDSRVWNNKTNSETIEYADDVSKYQYTIISRRGTAPMVQGAMYMAIADSYKPGIKIDKYGNLTYDKKAQQKAENTIKTFSNHLGGTFAAFINDIPKISKNYSYLLTPPLANGDDVSGHGYWNKNNMQIAPTQGNMEQFKMFIRELYKYNMGYIYDGTFTSEGLEGIHFQYALRWANQNPQSYYWFKMNGLKNGALGLGVIPENNKNLRHKLVNAPYNYEIQTNGTYKKVPNPKYNPNKETYFNIYDVSLASQKQADDTEHIIRRYEKQSDINELAINSHDDTLISYAFEIDPKEYDARINVINDLNKNFGRNIKLNSPEGTMLAGEFSNFKIDKKTEGGFVTWDANTDMAKMNYHISGYDTKNLLAIPDRAQRDYEKKMIERGAREVQDMTIQAGKYWTEKVKNTQIIYTAQTVGRLKTTEALSKLAAENKIPKQALLTEQELNNILNGTYLLEPKGILDKESITIKSLMKLPLDTLEFGENTQGVLSTSYFSNRAATDETIGLSRFDLYKQNNPHLVSEYADVYKKVNNLFTNELKDFAESVLKRINEHSDEKIFDANGDYTEYGEYVIEKFGAEIAKYAFIKSLSGSTFKPEILENGDITYNYSDIREATTLKSLGIKGYSPEDEAQKLENKMEKGLKSLSSSDIEFVSKAIGKSIANTDTMSFRIGEAMSSKAGRGLSWRLDALKDVMDMDAIRNKEDSFDDTWDNVIKFWSKFVQGVKEYNPHSTFIAEITDIPDLMRFTYGEASSPYNGATDLGGKFNGDLDTLTKFFNETGITSEAGYSYFFTDLLKIFAPEFESGRGISENHDSFKNRLDLLLQTRSIDYLRNLYTFMGNHDKPRMIHGLAVDMRLFHSPLLFGYDNGKANFSSEHKQREDAIRILSGAKTMSEVPVELRLNVDNNDYFKTVSSRAVAQSKLIMDTIDDLGNYISSKDAKLIKNALIDMSNGIYLENVKTPQMTRINIKELSSIEDAFKEILLLAKQNHHLNLTDTEYEAMVQKTVAKADEMDLSDFLVHGDFDWTGANEEIGKTNLKYLEEVLGTSENSMQYDLYTVQLARLVQKAFIESKRNPAAKEVIIEATKDFVRKYNRAAVNSARTEIPRTEAPALAMKKNGYASRDIKTAVNMAVKQAEFKSGKQIANKEDIINKIYQTATEPAVTKAAMVMEFLKGLPGMPTMYAGDELGMTGYEEKAKNVYLQNRNALPWEDLNKNSYRQTVQSLMNGTMQDRSNPELEALNSGTPYAMDVMAHNKNRDEVQARISAIRNELQSLDENSQTAVALREELRALTKDLAKIAYMMQSANGDITISLFNAGEVEFDNRYDYFKKYGLDTEEKRKKFFEENNIDSINPENRYVPIQPKSELDAILLGTGVALPIGTIFMNANARDKAQYVVKEINGKLGIVRKDGNKIIMDGLTSKNGVMILKHLKKMAFRGKNTAFYNQKYNLVSNPYVKEVSAEEGKNLSIIAK